jgi:hypothetical protein
MRTNGTQRAEFAGGVTACPETRCSTTIGRARRRSAQCVAVIRPPAIATRESIHPQLRMPAAGRVLAAPLLLAAVLTLAACRGEQPGPGAIRGAAIPADVIASRLEAQRKAEGTAEPGKQILFGDLHAHTVWSADAYLMSLPVMQGQGVHPIADACDFARYCSALDFWGVSDHAESLTPRRWDETVETMRQCEAVSQGSTEPDLMSFLGWEWTQIGLTPDEHFGHRNVVLRHLEAGKIPERPIAATAFAGQVMSDKLPWTVRYLLPLADWRHRGRYLDFLDYWRSTREGEECPPGVHVKEVTADCMDYARTPSDLFDKLRQWQVEATVIPHGTGWGLYTPPGYFIDKSLRGSQNDEEFQRLVEISSGNGSSEQYRGWREAEIDPEGDLVCPAPQADYEPCCWRAGEIMRSRCDEPESAECLASVEDARRNFLAAGASGRLTLAGAGVEAWGACGQCVDCFQPVFSMRPGGSVQYALALTDFSEPGRGPNEQGGTHERPSSEGRRFHFGFVAGSDSHKARPGTGYKEVHRHGMTETFGPRSRFWSERIQPGGAREAESEAIDPKNNRFERFQLLDFEGGSSFFYTGGLMAVHADRRDRGAVWDAMQRREVYATSGERILLWFDLVRGRGRVASMGAGVDWQGRPRFRVRAVGSFEQKPGCPDHAIEGIESERLEQLCGGECYNPGETRRTITRIEVVRIRPQVRPGEPIDELVEDPWKTIECPKLASGCDAEFEDEEFAGGARDALYYVRAIQEPTPAVNAAGLRCKSDETKPCAEVEPCYGDWRTPYDDDCLAPSEERAWSSPIYLTWKPATTGGR